MDQYTEPSWESRFEAVACMKVRLAESEPPPPAAAQADAPAVVNGRAIHPSDAPDARSGDEEGFGAGLGAEDSIDGAKNTEPPRTSGVLGGSKWRAVRDSKTTELLLSNVPARPDVCQSSRISRSSGHAAEHGRAFMTSDCNIVTRGAC